MTRLPQPATSSSLVRRTNSDQVKSVSWFSGPGDRDEVAQGVGLVAGEEVADVDDDAARRRELPALHGEELAADHLGRQLQLAEHAGLAALAPLPVVAEQLGRPDLGVEGDVVLAHEVVRHRASGSFHQARQASGSPLRRAHSIDADR